MMLFSIIDKQHFVAAITGDDSQYARDLQYIL